MLEKLKGLASYALLFVFASRQPQENSVVQVERYKGYRDVSIVCIGYDSVLLFGAL